MEAFRNMLKGWGGKVLLTIFILPFAFFGLEGLFQGGGRNATEITVNGTDISAAEVDRAAELQRRNLAQQFGGQVDPSMLNDAMVRPAAIEMLVNQRLLKQSIEDQGMAVSSEKAKAYIRSMPQFQDETGAFSQTRLEQLIAQTGYTPTGLVEEVRNEMLMNQLRTGISASAFSIPGEAEALLKLSHQARSFATLTLKPADYRDSVTVSDEDIQRFYEANKNRFRTPEKIKAEYLHIKPADFDVADEDVSEDTLQQLYKKEIDALAKDERRRAQHILADTSAVSEKEALAKIKEAQAALAKGEAFADVAGRLSDDAASAKLGGDLGFAGKGVYDPAFEDALFSLEKEAVSDIVKTEFGYHLIRLTEVQSETLPDFEAEKPRLLTQAKQDMAREQLELMAEEVSQKAFEHPDTLVDAGELAGVEPQQTEWLAQGEGEGVVADPVVVRSLFNPELIESRENSDLIELENGDLVFVRIVDYADASVKPLADVKEEVKASAIAEKADEKVAELANKWLAKLDDGTTMDNVAKNAKQEWQQVKDRSRRDQKKEPEVNPEVLNKVFAMAAPKADAVRYDKLALSNGEQVLLALEKVTDSTKAITEDDKKQLQRAIEAGRAQASFGQFVEALRGAADIEITERSE